MNLSMEQKERLRERMKKNDSKEEFMNFVKEEDLELSDEDLEEVNGGSWKTSVIKKKVNPDYRTQ